MPQVLGTQQVAYCLFKSMCIVCPEIGSNKAPGAAAAAAAAAAEEAASTDREKSRLFHMHTMHIRTMKSLSYKLYSPAQSTTCTFAQSVLLLFVQHCD